MRWGLRAWWRRLAIGLTLAFAAGTACAETNFTLIGGVGNGGFEDRCPAGKYLVGFKGQAGAWINMFQIVCIAIRHAPVAASPLPGSQIVGGIGGAPVNRAPPPSFEAYDAFYFGPLRGGRAGGGPVTVICTNGQALTGIRPQTTASNGQVKYIAIWCGDGFGDHDPTQTPFIGPGDNPYADTSSSNVQPTVMWCPTGEAGVGVRGRYGLDVNAVALICDPFNPDPAPPTTTPKPIHITGRAAGDAPAPNPWPASLFTGDWTVSSTVMGTFDLSMLQVTTPKIGAVGKDGVAEDEIDGSALRHDTNHATMTFKQPGRGRTGTIDITISADANAFTGLGSLSSGEAITWQGTRKTPLPPQGMVSLPPPPTQAPGGIRAH